jgi:hypothetical protein
LYRFLVPENTDDHGVDGFVVLLCFLPGSSLLLKGQGSLPDVNPRAYSNAKLGFSYVPPAGMIDSTAQAIHDLNVRAAHSHARNVVGILLSLFH